MLVAALVLFTVAIRVLPGEQPSGAERFDVLGGVLLGLGAGLALFGITQTQVAGPAEPLSWGSLLAAAVALLGFGLRTARVARPFIPRELFTNQVYRTAVLITFLSMTVNLGALVLVPLLVVDVNQLSPGAGALVMIPAGIAVAGVSPLIGRLTNRLDSRALLLTGMTLMALSALFLSSVAGNSSPIPAAVGILGLSVGFILVLTHTISTAAGALPSEQVGVGVGLLQGAQFLGAGTGPALFTVLLSARQGHAALNPLHTDPAGAAYSDTYLAMAVIAAAGIFIVHRGRAT